MAAEHRSILFKKHLVWTDTMDWLTMSSPNKRLQWTKWDGSLEQCPQQTLHSPTPVTTQTQLKNKTKKHQNKHFWLIFGGTNWKQIKANGHWDFPHLAFSRACSQMETHFLPWLRWLGGPASSPTHSCGPKWTLGSNWDLRVEGCPLGHPGSINISKDNP